MSINKNFPNYRRALLPAKVISRDPAGPNREQRRLTAKHARGQAEYERKFDARLLHRENRDARRLKIENIHAANRVRSTARRAALRQSKEKLS